MGKYRTSNKQIIANPCIAKPKPDQNHNNKNPKSVHHNLGPVQKFKLTTAEWKRLKRHVTLIVWAAAYALIFSISSYYPTTSAASIKLTNKQQFGSEKVQQGQSSAPSAIPTLFPSYDYTEEFEDLIQVKPNCSWPSADNFPADVFTQSERQHGWIALHFIASFVVFYTIYLVCEDYFVPSIECFCRELHLPSDIAGATLMACSTSAPELATNVVGTFITKGDLGVGTIVGSAVFNILAVGACCGIGATLAVNKIRGADGRVGIPLEWWPLTRDCIFYAASVGLLIVVLSNRRIYWYEALSMVLFYLMYIMIMCNNNFFKSLAEKVVYGIKGLFVDISEEQKKVERLSITIPKNLNKNNNEILKNNERTPLITIGKLNAGEASQGQKDFWSEVNNLSTVVILFNSLDDEIGYKSDFQIESSTSNEHHYDVSATIIDEVLINKALTHSESQCVLEQVEYGLCSLPYGESWTTWLEFIISWPLHLILRITIPDCREYRYRKWYPVTLLMCIVWISGLSYFVSWMMSIIGETLYIPDSVTGLSFLAAGTSIPEVISSVIVARQGLGSMGLSNSIGSNTFDILVCLGLPWLIETLILMDSDQEDFIVINSGGLEYSVILLIAALFVFYLIIVANRFLLDIKIGIASLILYVIFLTLACLLEMNYFFPVNLPPCVD